MIGVGIATLVLCLSLGSRLGSWGCGIASGVLLACSLFAGGLGLVLLPFSLIGLFALIGVLGFVPFLTATKERLARAYHDLTGEDVEQRLHRLDD